MPTGRSSSITTTMSWARLWMIPCTSRSVASGETTSGVSKRGCARCRCVTIRFTVARLMSCGSTPRPPSRAMVSAIRLPVTAFMF